MTGRYMTYLTYEELVRLQKAEDMTRFSNFTDKELDAMEEAFCIQGLLLLVEEVRKEKRFRTVKGIVSK